MEGRRERERGRERQRERRRERGREGGKESEREEEREREGEREGEWEREEAGEVKVWKEMKRVFFHKTSFARNNCNYISITELIEVCTPPCISQCYATCIYIFTFVCCTYSMYTQHALYI